MCLLSMKVPIRKSLETYRMHLVCVCVCVLSEGKSEGDSLDIHMEYIISKTDIILYYSLPKLDPIILFVAMGK